MMGRITLPMIRGGPEASTWLVDFLTLNVSFVYNRKVITSSSLVDDLFGKTSSYEVSYLRRSSNSWQSDHIQ